MNLSDAGLRGLPLEDHSRAQGAAEKEHEALSQGPD